MIDIEKEYAKKHTVTPIWLGNNHKVRLFEMCNNVIENNNPTVNIYIQDYTIRIPKQGNQFGYDSFHWFEICTTHLAFHIVEDPKKYMEHCVTYAMINNKELMEHPIDYLYREYQVVKELFLNKVK